ncbi:MAG: transposase [Defluviitaleaceae bacterium]|nr:transposase [Defluviitaleaceae bacterium]
MKLQIIIDRGTEEIISIELFNCKAHDLTILKQTTKIAPTILVVGDSGYRGMQKVYKNTLLPIRHKADINKLTEEQKLNRKATNKAIASIRMKVEHVIGRIKRFKIVAERYRNRLKLLGLRVSLICGIVNFERLRDVVS